MGKMCKHRTTNKKCVDTASFGMVHKQQWCLYGGSVPFDLLLESQQFTNLATMFAHFCTSPSRYGSLLSLVMFSKSCWMFVMWGKYVSLMSWYSGQVVKKCSSVSTSFCVQWLHSLSSLGSQVCLWRPLSMARLCSLSLYLVKDFLSFGSVTVLRYSATVYSLFRVR